MGVAEKGSRGDGEGEKAGSRTRAMYFVYRISPDEERTTSDESHDAGYPGRKGRFYMQAELRIVALFATHAAYGTEALLERGSKEEIWLTPMIASNLEDFGRLDLNHRLLRGGRCAEANAGEKFLHGRALPKQKNPAEMPPKVIEW